MSLQGKDMGMRIPIIGLGIDFRVGSRIYFQNSDLEECWFPKYFEIIRKYLILYLQTLFFIFTLKCNVLGISMNIQVTVTYL